MTEKKEFQVNKNTPFWDASLTDQERIARSLTNSSPLAWVKRASSSGTVRFPGSAAPWHSGSLCRR